MALCPCTSGKLLAQCCGQYHQGAPAPSAEALMRSRYSAFVLGLRDYLLATWHSDTRPATLDLDTSPPTKWLGLEVKRFAATGANSATVEFVARCKIGGRAQRLHETSRFVSEDGRWYYRDGDL